MKLDNLHVIVVGGAIGGAASALLLARAGARVTLLEKVAHPRAVGAGLSLAENGLAVLESLGLLPALARAGRILDAPRITDARGHTLFAPPADSRVMMIRRSALHGTLLDALAAEPRIECRFGVEVTAARDGTVTTAAGDLSADLVIGAD